MRTRTSKWKGWVAGGAILGVTLLIWALWPSAPERVATQGLAGKPSATGPSDTLAPGTFGAQGRVLEVMVEGCQGPAPDALVFVRVGEALVSGTTDPRGKVLLATTPGAAEVRARVAGWEASALAGETDRTVLVRACRSGEVHGRVWDIESSHPPVGLVVRLMDGGGAVLDETLTGPRGDYRLVDADLVGDHVEVLDGSENQLLSEPLEPLRPGEARELNLILGATFELVGWVLDTRGEPLPGVLVRISGNEDPMTWQTYTDGGGGFRFERAPDRALLLTADGGELGFTQRRLTAYTPRVEVTLVLEPTGNLIVYGPPGHKGRVEVLSYGMAEVSVPDPLPVLEDDLSAVTLDGQGEAPDPEFEALQQLATEALAAFDPDDPVGGGVQLLMQLRTLMPELEQNLRAAIATKLGPQEDTDFETLARLAIEQAYREEPQMAELLSRASRMAREGTPGLDAIMMAEAELTGQDTGQPDPNESGHFEGYEVEGEPPEVEGELPLEPELADLPPELAHLGDPTLLEPALAPALIRLRQRFGENVFPHYPIPQYTVASGPSGQALTVPGGFRYSILFVLDPSEGDGERYAILCGELLVPAGRTLEFSCGQEGETQLSGRVVDTRGRPVEGAAVWFDEVQQASTDRNGEYLVRGRYSVASPCTLRVTHEAGGETWRPSGRVNLPCGPGMAQEVPTIVLRREEEAPVDIPDGPFGGVGGALSYSPEGVRLSYVMPDGPLDLDGISEGALILRVDDEEATTWPIEEMLARLRGEVGVPVQLQVRASDGELIETVIERGLVNP